jgi:O-antigen/teichoic acid export membrane protein
MSNFKNFSIYTLSQAINSGLRFILIPYYSSVLSVEDFGKVGVVWIIVPILTILIDMGFASSFCLKFYNLNNQKRKNLFNSIFLLFIGSFVIWTYIIYLFYGKLEVIFSLNISRSYYIQIAIIGFTTCSIQFLLTFFKINLQPMKFMIYNTFYTALTIIMLIYFIKFKDLGFIGFIQGTLVCNIVVFIIFFIDYMVSVGISEFNFELDLIKGLLRLGVPIVFGGLISFILNSGDRYVIKQVSNSLNDVGLYTMGYKIGEVFNTFLIMPYLTSINPIIFKDFSHSEEKYSNSIIRFIDTYILGTTVLFLGFNSVVPIIYRCFINVEYSSSINIVSIVTISYIIFGLGQLLASNLLVKEKISITTVFGIFASVVNIALNYILIPVIGIRGAAVATMIAYFSMFIMYYVYSNKLIKINYNLLKYTKLIALGVIAYLCQLAVNYLIGNLIYVALIINILLVLILLLIVLKAKLFPEVNSMVSKVLSKNSI